MIVLMWEATVASGDLDRARAHLRENVVPAALAAPGCTAAEGFVAEGDPSRVVVISRWHDGADVVPPAASSLWRRDQSWPFRPLDA